MKAIQIKQKPIIDISDDERRFNDLIDSIENKNVLLVIGKGFELNKDSDEYKKHFTPLGVDTDVYDYILDNLKKEYNSEAIDFTELNEDANFSVLDGNIKRKKNIYKAIQEKLIELDLELEDVNTKLRELLKTGCFRFVFTTSFSPLVEKAMQKQWGEENVRILNIFDSDVNKQDIVDSQRDLLTPTVYYLFGKAEGSNSFVVTDNDALNIIYRWMHKMSDSKILEAAHNKHILALGCVQEDWLFRFIWYALKGEGNISKGSVGRYANSDSLEKYLRRNNILQRKDADAFVDKIIAAINERQKQKIFGRPRKDCDVFISYSRRDGDVAEAVYDALLNAGLSVWYDKQNLGGRGGDYMLEIYHAIETCKMFIPILTPTISEQKAEIHPYRLEWDRAINGLIKQKGVKCCIPVIDDKYDLYNKAYEDKIPEAIKAQDGFIFNRLTLNFYDWAEEVRRIIIEENK